MSLLGFWGLGSNTCCQACVVNALTHWAFTGVLFACLVLRQSFYIPGLSPTQYVTMDDLPLFIILPLPPGTWDYGRGPPHLFFVFVFPVVLWIEPVCELVQVWAQVLTEARGLSSPRAGHMCNGEPPDISAGNWTEVLYKAASTLNCLTISLACKPNHTV